MLVFEAKARIDADAATVWAILTDVAKYPEFDPYCVRIEGSVAPGAKLKAYSTLAPGRAFGVKVTELNENTRMEWSGGMPFGLFKGVRSFTLSPAAEGGVDFALREEFSGPMLGMIKGSLPDMTGPFAEFAAGLKARAESQ